MRRLNPQSCQRAKAKGWLSKAASSYVIAMQRIIDDGETIDMTLTFQAQGTIHVLELIFT